MKFKTGILLGLIAIAGLITWGFYNQVKLLASYCFNVVGHRIRKIGLNQMIIELQLEVLNKSKLDATIKDYEFDVFINNQFVTKIHSVIDQPLKSDGRSLIELLIDFNPREVLKTVVNVDFIAGIMDKSKIIIRLIGTISVSHKGIQLKNLPVEIEMPLADMLPGKGVSQPC